MRFFLHLAALLVLGTSSVLAVPQGNSDCAKWCQDNWSKAECGYKNQGTCVSDKCTCSCASGMSYCSSTKKCCDFQKDNNNCGKCDNKCKSGESCKGGKCEPDTPAKCPDGKEKCDGGCPDYDKDKNNCGSCGKKCNSGESCKGGKCEPDTPAPCPVAGEVMCDKGKNKDKCCKPEDCKEEPTCPSGEAMCDKGKNKDKCCKPEDCKEEPTCPSGEAMCDKGKNKDKCCKPEDCKA